jgi:hypothetical protein
MRLTIFTYERQLDIPHEIQYIDAPLIHSQGIEKTIEEIRLFNPDLIIEREFNDGKAIYSSLYTYLKDIPKAYWSIDAHITLAEHINYAKQFQYVFLAQSWFIPLFAHEVKSELFYLPLCHTQTLTEYEKYMADGVERVYPFTFTGNVNSLHVDRSKILAQIKEICRDDFQMGSATYEDTLLILRKSKASFNCSLNNDLNFRVWESLAMNTPIFTDRVTDIERIANLADYVILYDKKEPQYNNLQLLPDTSTFDSYSFIKSNHTLTHRYEQLLEMVKRGWQHPYV